MKDTWWQHKAAELQQYSDEHNFKRFFEGSKTVYMAPLSISWLLSHIRLEPCLQGSQISFKVGEKSLANFSTNRPVSNPRYTSAPGSKLSWRSPNTGGNPEKNKKLQAGKAPVPDEIPSSRLQGHQRHPTVQEQRWQSIVWQPQRQSAVEYYRKSHGTYHTELYHTRPLGWFRVGESVCLQEKQRDNRHDIRRTTYQGKCREQNQSLYILFVHLTKAFDTVGKWVGHVSLMDDRRLPKMVFFSEVAGGTRSIGHPLRRFKEALKQKTELNPTLRWETFATDRNAWRMAVHKGVQGFEKSGWMILIRPLGWPSSSRAKAAP